MTERATELKGRAGEYARVLRKHLPALKEHYGVASLGIFGSYVRGEEQEGSDLDLLVEISRPTDLIEFGGLEIHLSDLLGVEVDLVMRRALKKHIGQRILREVLQV